jgi:hypothetical protein
MRVLQAEAERGLGVGTRRDQPEALDRTADPAPSRGVSDRRRPLIRTKLAGLRNATFRLDDRVAFGHVAVDDGESPRRSSRRSRRSRKGSASGARGAGRVELHEIGSFRLPGELV